MEIPNTPFHVLAGRCARPLLVIALTLGGPLQVHRASAQLPASPQALVAELGRALSAKDLDAYAALLSDDYVFVPQAEVSVEALDRAADLDVTRRFLSAAFVVEAEFRIESETQLSDGVRLGLRTMLMVQDSEHNGHRIDGVIQELVAISTASGWQMRSLADGPPPLGMPADAVCSWHALRLEYAARVTAVSNETWAQIKALRRDAPHLESSLSAPRQ